jgi:hypothetical protein
LNRIAMRHGIIVKLFRHVKTGASLVHGRKKIVLLNPDISGHFRRLVLAHELAHIVLGHHGRIDEEVEHEAEFVSAIALYPAREFFNCTIRSKNLDPSCITRYLSSRRDHADSLFVGMKLYAFFANRIDSHKATCPHNFSCQNGIPCQFLKNISFPVV